MSSCVNWLISNHLQIFFENLLCSRTPSQLNDNSLLHGIASYIKCQWISFLRLTSTLSLMVFKRLTRSWTSFLTFLKSLNCCPIRNILSTKSTTQSANFLHITVSLLIMCFNNYSALFFHVALYYSLYHNYLKFTTTE